MGAQGKDVVRISELTASVAATPTKGNVSASINVRTPEPALALAVVAVIGVSAVIGVAVMTSGLPRQQSAELALTADDDGGRSPQRLEPHA